MFGKRTYLSSRNIIEKYPILFCARYSGTRRTQKKTQKTAEKNPLGKGPHCPARQPANISKDPILLRARCSGITHLISYNIVVLDDDLFWKEWYAPICTD